MKNGTSNGHAMGPDRASWVPPPPDGFAQASAEPQCAADWADRDIPPRRWILPDWIPVGQCTGIYGRGGVNKTDLLLQLMTACVLGTCFLGYQMTPQSVLGVFCEDDEAEIARRVQRKVAHYGCNLGDLTQLHFASLVGCEDTELVVFDGPQMLPTPRFAWLEQHILMHGAKLVVLDTLPDFFGGNEIVRRDVSRYIRKLDGLAMRTDCALLFSAHPSQAGIRSGELDSGSSAWSAKVRSRLTLHDPGTGDEEDERSTEQSDRRVLTRVKSNYARQGDAIELICRDGIFVPAALDGDAAMRRGPLRDAAAEARFLDLLAKVGAEGSYVHDAATAPSHFAPVAFARRPDRGGFGQGEFFRAMQRLRVAGRIRLAPARVAGRDRIRWIAVPEIPC